MIAPGKDESADDVPMTSLPVNYKYFALAGAPPRPLSARPPPTGSAN